MSTLTAAQLADALRLILEYEAGQHGEPGVIGCKTVDDAREVLAAYDAQTAADKTDCRIPHSKCAPCRNCEPIDDTPPKTDTNHIEMFVRRQPCRCLSVSQAGTRDAGCDRCKALAAITALSARASAGEGERVWKLVGTEKRPIEQEYEVGVMPKVPKPIEWETLYLWEAKVAAITKNGNPPVTPAPQPAQAGASGGGEAPDDEGRCRCGCTENCAHAAELRGEVNKLRSVIRRMVSEDDARFAQESTAPASPAAVGLPEAFGHVFRFVSSDASLARRWDASDSVFKTGSAISEGKRGTLQYLNLYTAEQVQALAAARQPQHWSADSPLYKDDVVSEQDARECFKGECPAPYCECSAGECKQAHKGYQRTSSGVKKGVPR